LHPFVSSAGEEKVTVDANLLDTDKHIQKESEEECSSIAGKFIISKVFDSIFAFRSQEWR